MTSNIPFLTQEVRPEHTKFLFDLRDQFDAAVKLEVHFLDVRMHMNLEGRGTATFFLRDNRPLPHVQKRGVLYEVVLIGSSGEVITYVMDPDAKASDKRVVEAVHDFTSIADIEHLLTKAARRYLYKEV